MSSYYTSVTTEIKISNRTAMTARLEEILTPPIASSVPDSTEEPFATTMDWREWAIAMVGTDALPDISDWAALAYQARFIFAITDRDGDDYLQIVETSRFDYETMPYLLGYLIQVEPEGTEWGFPVVATADNPGPGDYTADYMVITKSGWVTIPIEKMWAYCIGSPDVTREFVSFAPNDKRG